MECSTGSSGTSLWWRRTTSPSGSSTKPTLKKRPGNSGWRALACAITKTPHLRARRPSWSVSGPGMSIAHSRANVSWSRSSTSSLKPWSAPSGTATRRTGRSSPPSQADAVTRWSRCSRFLKMSSRRRMPHIVGTSPIAWYGSITSRSSRGWSARILADFGSHPQLLADQAIDLAAVGAALGLAHDGADQGAHGLRVAAADALRDVRIVGDHLGDDVGQLIAGLHRGEALALDDRGRVAALGHQAVEHLTAGAGVDGARLDEPDQLRQGVRRHVGLRRIGLGADARAQIG